MTVAAGPGTRSTGGGQPADRWVIVAPHFGHPGHLGGVRCERYQRWLSAMGCSVTVVRAGASDRSEDLAWGECITIRDPLGFYSERGSKSTVPPAPRSPNRLRTAVAHALFVPDPVMCWVWRVVRSPLVRRAVDGAAWVLSSSPPESSHLAAARLARRVGALHYVDFRDGWLDEPMIPLLGSSSVQRWRHRRLETDIVTGAAVVVVTSKLWRELLVARYPEAEAKVETLPNACCGDDCGPGSGGVGHRSDRLTLLYAGKIYSSRPERRVEQLMRPLIMGIDRSGGVGVLEFVGNLRDDEVRDLESYAARLESVGWRLAIRPPVSRADLQRRVAAADGLLLLATSKASIPGKLFDYLPSRRPILAVTPQGSELDGLAALIPQLYVSELGAGTGCGPVVEFLQAARTGDYEAAVHSEFTEAVLQRRFAGLVTRAGEVSRSCPVPPDRASRIAGRPPLG